MSIYGAKYLRWAPFAAESPDADPKSFPKYGAAVDLGALVSVTDNITYAEARNYGDNELQEYVSEFQELAVDVEITEMATSVAASVYGATLDTDTGDLNYGTEDAAPYGGLAFYANKQVKANKFYQGVFYPKLKASRQGATYNTKGQSITFANGKAHFAGVASANGKFQVFSKNFSTEEEAKAWVDAKLAGTTSTQ